MIRAVFLFFLLFPGEVCAQLFQKESQKEKNLPPFSETFVRFSSRERDRVVTDFGNLYDRNDAKNYGLALLGASILANTSMDAHFQNWHDKHIRSGFTDELGKVSKVFGEGIIFVPVIAASAGVYRFRQERRGLPDCPFGEFADRTTRGYLVGAPTLIVFQSVLGADRPHDGSQWKPFQNDKGVSGHAFIGAVPFITAAQMTDRPCAKGLFYALSTIPAWSRVNDDAHYLSQVLLGWYLAYLSVRAVTETEERSPLPKGLTLFPVADGVSVGIGLHYRY